MKTRKAAASPAAAFLLLDRRSDLEVLRGLSAAIGNDFIRDRLALIEGAQAGTFDGGNMDKNVLAAALRLNETVAFCGVKPLDSSGRHRRLLDVLLVDSRRESQHQARVL